MTSKPKITSSSLVKHVQEELSHISSSDKWKVKSNWDYFKSHKNNILKIIIQEINPDHLDAPSTTDLIDAEFVRRAKEHWKDVPERIWVLGGDWLDLRKDLVSWMRTNYVKNHKTGLERKASPGGVDARSASSAYAIGGDNGEGAEQSSAGGKKFWNVVNDG